MLSETMTLHPVLALPSMHLIASHDIHNLAEPQTRCKLLIAMTTLVDKPCDRITTLHASDAWATATMICDCM